MVVLFSFLFLVHQAQQKWKESVENLDKMKGMLEPEDVAGLVTNLQLRAGIKHDLKEYPDALALLTGRFLFIFCFVLFHGEQ